MPSMVELRAQTFQREVKGDLKQYYKAKLVEWRNGPNVVKLDRPTRLDRARELGYKAKPGIVVVRSVAKKGGFFVPRPRAGRRPKNMGVKLIKYNINAQTIAERKAAESFPGMEVLGSYFVGEDGKHKWYEVILVDPHNPSIKNDGELNWICNPAQKNRVYRGLTPAGRRSRGLRHKGVRDGFLKREAWKKKEYISQIRRL